MGRQKLLLQWNGKPVLRWSVDRVRPHVDDCIVVVPPDGGVIREALAGLAVRFVVNPRPQDGQGTSIAAGAAALEASATAALIALGDQPTTPPSVIPALLAAQAHTGRAIVVPSYRGTRGTPVLFSRACFAELAALTGDVGARGVVSARPDRVHIVDIDAPMPADVDTPEDYARLQVRDQAAQDKPENRGIGQ